MTDTTSHEPETKGFNKAREFQDMVIRARRNGCADPLEVAEEIYEEFMAAPRTVQIATLQYAAGRIWGTVDDKLEEGARSSSSGRGRGRGGGSELSQQEKDRIRAETRAKLDKQWLDLIIVMTGAQVRAAKALPDSMAEKVGDDQKVGEVFTAAELKAARLEKEK